MSKKIKDGGAAFPRSDAGYSETQDGMTLRDFFAGNALQGMLACSREGDAHQAWLSPSAASEWAYQQADAMIAEREKSNVLLPSLQRLEPIMSADELARRLK